MTHPVQLVRGAFQPSSPARRVLLELGAGLKPLLGLSRLGRAPPPRSTGHRPAPALGDGVARPGGGEGGPRRLGGTVNDVLLAVVAARSASSSRSGTSRPRRDPRAHPRLRPRQRLAGALGNRVTALFCELPVGEPDAWKRLRTVAAEIESLKESGQAVGALAWTHLGDFAPPALLAQVARFQSTFRYMNLVVTNIPGPQEPIYLLGRKMLEWYPLVPLAQGQTLGSPSRATTAGSASACSATRRRCATCRCWRRPSRRRWPS